MNKWIRKGDKVIVIAGNEKGQTGKVLSRSKERVVIEGLNIRKKHMKPKSRMQPGVIDLEGPIHISNVSLCNDEGKPIKLKIKKTEAGNKQLVYFEGEKEVLYRELKK